MTTANEPPADKPNQPLLDLGEIESEEYRKDVDFSEYTIAEIQNLGGGKYSFRCRGTGSWLDYDAVDGTEPQIGEVVRIFPANHVQTIRDVMASPADKLSGIERRGLAVGGRLYEYTSPRMLAELQEAKYEMKDIITTDDIARQAEWDARYQQLPSILRERLDFIEMQQGGRDAVWWHKMEQTHAALRIVRELDDDSFNSPLEAITALQQLSLNDRVRIFPWLREDSHYRRMNAQESAVELAAWYLQESAKRDDTT